MTHARAMLLFVLAGATAALAGACVSFSLLAADGACEVDAQCAPALCVLGSCVDPNAVNVDAVDVLVTPLMGSGMKPQVVAGLSLRQSTRHVITLRPTLNLDLRACYDCTAAVPGTLAGTLQLTAPSAIEGISQVETATLDGNSTARVGLLQYRSYNPVLYPADLAVPILRGPQLFATAGTAIEIEFPSPQRILALSGRVVRGSAPAGNTPLERIKAWVVRGEERLTRDVLTGADGRFQLNVLEDGASALTLKLSPESGTLGLPSVDVTSLNLDGNRDLGDISLGLDDAPAQVEGRVTGPDGSAVTGAQVRLEGPAGAGMLVATASTDVDGKYSVAVPAGTYAMAVVPTSGSNASIRQDPMIVVPSTSAGAGMTLDVALAQAPQLCGQVVNEAGTGVGQARVQAVRVGNAAMAAGPASAASLDVRATTDGSGQYCMGLQPGAFLVTAAPPEATRLPQRTDLLDVGGESRSHVTKLPPAALLVGTVRGPDGAAVPLARVKAFSPDFATARGALNLGESFTDENGNFTVPVPDLAPAAMGTGP